MKINGQYSSINIGPTNRLIFKYQKLTRKFINFNWEYFSSQHTRVVENPSAFKDRWTISRHLHGSLSIKINLGTRAYNKFEMLKFIHWNKSLSYVISIPPIRNPSKSLNQIQTTQCILFQVGCTKCANTFSSHEQSLNLWISDKSITLGFPSDPKSNN
jgi:hypothetical protein